MDTRNPQDMSTHSNAFHEQRLALFDAYVTGELDEDERAQVEQHLKSCQECQQLFAEVTHFRPLLAMLSETGNVSGTERERPHSSPMIQAVMTSIEQGKKNMEHFTAYVEDQSQTSSRASNPPVATIVTRKRAWSLYRSIAVAVLCLFLVAGLIFTLSASLRKENMLPPPPIVWTTQQPMLVQNSAGVFALKEIEITTVKELRFYYVFKSSHQGTLQATASSSLSSGQGRLITLPAIVQSLGTIDDFRVGVIRVQYLDRAGQTIVLHITSSAEENASWQLSPLKQQLAEPHPEGGSFYGLPVDQRIFSQIIWSGPRSGIALFKNAAGTHYIFLQVDYSGKIAVITKEECVRLISEQACH